MRDNKYLNICQIGKKAAWKFPVWNNFFIPGLKDRALAFVCDGCQEAAFKSGVPGRIKYAVEFNHGKVIMHDVDELEDADPIQDMIDFNFNTSQVNVK